MARTAWPNAVAVKTLSYSAANSSKAVVRKSIIPVPSGASFENRQRLDVMKILPVEAELF
jgi:hypothetical protein